MRIVLVKPNEVSDSIQPNLGLGFLAGAIGPGHEVHIIDGILENLSHRALVRKLAAIGPDVVGFQLNSFTIQNSLQLVNATRAEIPNVFMMAGGPHPSVLAENTIRELGPALDAVIAGEAEDAISALIARLDGTTLAEDARTDIPGLVWCTPDGSIKMNPRGVTDLSTVSAPRWDLLDPRRFPPSPHSAFFRAWPIAPIVASRGCPYACSFCAGSKIHGRRVRYRPVAAVIDEISYLVKHFGVKEIQFVDDNLTWSRDYVVELCAEIDRLPYRIPWSCPNGVRLDSLDDDLLGTMKSAGCYAVGMGIESGSDRILASVRKGLELDQVRDRVEAISRAGIETRGFFVLGFPTETIEDMEATITLALDLPLDFAHFMFYHPIPGTASYDDVIREHGGTDAIRWNAPTFAEVAYTPTGITPGQLKSIRRSALLRFYMRPRQLAMLTGHINSPHHAWYLARRILRWLT